MIIKILASKVDGTQYLFEVGDGGGVGLDYTVIWDERLDGTFPPAQLVNVGGLVKSGKNLTFNATLKATNDALLKVQTDAVAQAILDKKAVIARLQAVDSVTDLAGAKTLLKDLIAVIIPLIQKDIPKP